MKLSRIIKRRKYKASKDKINLFAGSDPTDMKSGLPPKLERPVVTSESQTVKDIFESIKKSQQEANG